ncbi:MAG: hypothetical protein J5441_02435 [Clostridia bacterium]|nr:hypothetical protein [Clostridia bacterium]
MFAERLNTAFETVGASPSDIARSVGCDRSNISRMCKGVRVPKKGAASSRRLVEGLCAFASEKGSAPALRVLIGCEPEESDAYMRQRLTDWLYDGVNTISAKPRKEKRLAPFAQLGGRLNAVMELAELSNVRFGHLLNLDASYISRFRNGQRSPESNPQMVDDICTVLLKRLTEQNRLAEFAALAEAPEGKPEDEEEAFFLLREWLFDTGRDLNVPAVEKLLENLESFAPRMSTPLLPPEELAERSVLHTGERIYYGVDGLRSAVLRFLSGAMRERMKELCLYSDQNLDWMNGDAEFNARLFSLLLGCLSNGTKITVIHNVDRASGEMFSAIYNWLPLYMSGGITSYYFRRQNQSRFSYTLFLCPGYACVEGGGVVGGEELHGIYRYDTDSKILEAHKTGFDAMLATSKPLVKVYGSDSAERIAAMSGSALSVVGVGLPVSVMPEETLRRMLARSGASEEESRQMFAVLNARRSVLEKNLSGGYMHLCGVLADKETIAAGKVAVDLPGVRVYYTPEEYAEQIRGVLSLMDNYPNFRFFILPEAVFENVQISVTESSIAVSRLKEPRISFLVTHAYLREAFAAFVGSIEERCIKDEKEARRRLERYL